MGPSVTGGPRVGKWAKRERGPAPPPAMRAARVLRAASARAPETVEGDARNLRGVIPSLVDCGSSPLPGGEGG